MNITQIENTVTDLLKEINKNTFIYDLLLAYGKPKSNIKRLKEGNFNMSKTEGEVSWKKEVFFKILEGQLIGDDDLEEVLAGAVKNIKYKQRFVIVTDYKRFLAFDTKTIDRLDIDFKDLGKNYVFFLPWAGMEKAQHLGENPADVKAAERMARLFDELKKDNPDGSPESIHNLNVFLSRLLFCFFAEDTNIFEDNLFTNSLDSYTQKDGSDVHTYLNTLFDVLNLPKGDERDKLPEHIKVFPYVNGGLFADTIQCPEFSKRSRQLLIDSGELDWKDINPDIFGSMFQAVIAVDQRGTLGQHYTSVPNIMKVIQPLFLDALYEAYEEAKGNDKKISALLHRLKTIKIFDPACGSGNFLIIAYKELRQLEMKIFKETGQIALSGISLSQFYGIEIDDFAHEIAILALWLAEHQMNVEFFNEFGRTNPTLPLKAAGNIEQGNACRLDWEQVCPKEEGDEIYILGNPPYRGKKEQSSEQKADMEFVLKSIQGYKLLDFISIWFYKSAVYSKNSNVKSAFVTTNSICQGEQVGILWNEVFEFNVEIFFAYTSFMWTNSAKNKAGVAVVIIGLSSLKTTTKTLYTKERNLKTNAISPYLTIGISTIVNKRSKPLSKIPEMMNGSMANDNGFFFLSEEEYKSKSNDIKRYYKKILGARELFHSINRYALWLYEVNVKSQNLPTEIREIISNVKGYRLSSSREATKKLADSSHLFGEVRYQEGTSIIIPGLSAEKRKYIPTQFLSNGEIVSNLAQVIYTNNIWLLAVLSSRINIIWVQATSGYFKKDLRYSPILSYNNFPFPKISEDKKQEIENSVKNILKARANHSELTLAQMYDPDKMPDDLREAHHQNDLLIDSCYREKPFESDEERLEYLFKLYEKMITQEQRKIEKEKSKRTAKKK